MVRIVFAMGFRPFWRAAGWFAAAATRVRSRGNPAGHLRVSALSRAGRDGHTAWRIA